MTIIERNVTLPDVDEVSFSTQLRDGTAEVHRAAERVHFLGALMDGSVSASAYGRLVVQHLAIYEALESANDAMRDHPVVGAFVDDAVCRVEALQADADAVLGDDWLATPEATLMLSTVAYAERLRELGSTWPGGWLAHHYVRYLGDLSGGQFLARRLASHYGRDETNGAAFYAFPHIASPKAWKQAYRARLDAAPFGRVERARILDEARAAFAWNTAVLTELGEHC